MYHSEVRRWQLSSGEKMEKAESRISSRHQRNKLRVNKERENKETTRCLMVARLQPAYHLGLICFYLLPCVL